MKFVNIFLICAMNYFLQTSFFPMLSFLPAIPNTNLLVVLFSGVFFGNFGGAVIGLSVGLVQDMIFSHTMGMHALVLFLLGFSSGYLKEYFREGHFPMSLLLVAAGMILYHVLYYLVCYFFATDVLFLEFIREKLLAELILDLILGVPAFLLFKKLFAVRTLTFTD